MKRTILLLLAIMLTMANSQQINAQRLSALVTSQTNVSCNGGSNGSATVTAYGGTSPYTYAWFPGGATTATVTGLSAGLYNVTVTDNAGSHVNVGASITQPSALSLFPWVTGANAGVLVGGGTSPFTYNWGTFSNTSATGSCLSIGTYTINVTDHNGCSASTTVTITQPSLGVIGIATANVSCYGGNNGVASALVSGGRSPFTYLWNGGGTNSTKTGLSIGTYIVLVTDNNGCTATGSVIITQPGQLTVSTDVIHQVTCYGGSDGAAKAEAKGGVTPYTYSWSNGATTSATSGLSAGTYTITINDSHGCTATANVIITQPPAVVAGIVWVNSVHCSGGFDGMALATGSNGVIPYTYSWAPGGATTDEVTGLSAGTYTVYVTDAHGCTGTTSVNITQPAVLTVTTANIYSIAYAAVTGGTPPYSYTWSPGGSTSTFATGISAGTYTVVVEDADSCKDSAQVVMSSLSGPIIAFGFANPVASCGDTSMFSFDILVASYPATIFNSCFLFLKFPPGEFDGDFSPNSLQLTLGPNFQSKMGDSNNYVAVVIYSRYDSVQMIFGGLGDSSVYGTVIDSNPQVLCHIQLPITGCQPGPISFTADYNTDSYAEVTKSFSHLDSTNTGAYSLCCPYNCNPDSCFICCRIDTNTGLCADSCDTLCWHICHDTLWVYNYDSVFVITAYSNQPYNIVLDSLPINSEVCPLKITSYTDPVNAGTNSKSIAAIPAIPPNSSILDIQGNGFGNTKGFIQVCDANSGFDGKGNENLVQLDSDDILRWQENQIKVKMPSVLLGYPNSYPGSGPFTIFNSCGDSTSNMIQINYSILNDKYSGEKLRPDIEMANNPASFLWHCDTSVSHNPKALACVKKALREWNCYTGVNWKLGSDTAINDSIPGSTLLHSIIYGTSVIYFSVPSNFSSGTVMLTFPEYSTPFCSDTHDSVTFKMGSIIMINTDPRLRMSYDTLGIDAWPDSNYFYDDILHELGHAHGLAHINDTLSLMYWYTAYNFRPTIPSQGPIWPGPATLLGALDMINTSIFPANAPDSLGCVMYSKLDTSTRDCFDPSLSVSVISNNSYNLTIYPNPITNGSLMITYDLIKNSSVEFNIVDCIGRKIIQLNNTELSAGNYREQVNIDNLAEGVYLFVANINGEEQVIKFIKL